MFTVSSIPELASGYNGKGAVFTPAAGVAVTGAQRFGEHSREMRLVGPERSTQARLSARGEGHSLGGREGQVVTSRTPPGYSSGRRGPEPLCATSRPGGFRLVSASYAGTPGGEEARAYSGGVLSGS